MKRLQAFKYELQPNGEQARSMRRFAGSCRFVFNKALCNAEGHLRGRRKKVGLCRVVQRTHRLENSTGNRLAQRNTFAAFCSNHSKTCRRAYKNFFR
ncbi:MAG: helix-turn-helix domain-containing protein [Ferrovum myxofaciens]|nr:helix-turn-helix domain-containing protein [Ferrovum myxofaciens]